MSLGKRVLKKQDPPLWLRCVLYAAGALCMGLAAAVAAQWVVTGSIGKRYRREDEIGTPLCITVDFETVGDENTPADHCVTVRDRDTMEQVRIPIAELRSYIEKKLEF